MSAESKRKKKRYAEDPNFRLHTLAYNRGYYAANKDAINAQRRRKRAEDPDPNRKQRKYYSQSGGRAWLKYYYGITPEEYDALLEQQNGVCAICKKRSVERLCVDHDHPTDLIRGLLCRLCNLGLGHFKDDLARLRAAVAYLEAFEARAGRMHGVLPPPLAGEGWGGGTQASAFASAPSLSLPRKRGRER